MLPAWGTRNHVLLWEAYCCGVSHHHLLFFQFTLPVWEAPFDYRLHFGCCRISFANFDREPLSL